jgi:hypothetical protein
LEKKSRKGKIKFGEITEGAKVMDSKVLGFQGLTVKEYGAVNAL